MRSLRHFGLPGIDMLCDRVELTTAKQAQSAARQIGAPGTMSELYGLSNWDYPASIGEHSPWWWRYVVIEDHCAPGGTG